MINQKMLALGTKSSIIREIFEYGKKRKAEIGAENVFDFSLGNPNVPAPREVGEAISGMIASRDSVQLHGYTSAPGDLSVRSAIADELNRRYDVGAKPELIYMTCGAAAALTITLHAVVNEGDEVIVFAPFFPEYRVFAETAGAVLKVVPCAEPDFQIDFSRLEKALSAKTKAVIINSPNNPSGVVLSEDSIVRLSSVLSQKQREYGHEIYLLSDEPYRELVYGGVSVPYVTKYYDNTVVCYSYSKSLSLPGERIGYVFVSPSAAGSRELFFAVCGAGRALGFVCAPSLMQFTVGECVSLAADTRIYEKNRAIFLKELTRIGYTIVKPDGAFYLFVKSPDPDAGAFCELAKKFELLLVPSDDFGIPGYLRVSYCVSTKQVENSIPAFEKLYKEFTGEVTA